MAVEQENVVPENSTKPVPEAARGLDFSQDLAAKGWYHSFEFADGAVIDGYMPLHVQKERYARYPFPDDLRGKRVLDIGAWDGWFSFETERHGADTTAIDCVEIPTFLQVHRRLGSKVDYRVLDFYELPGACLGKFDVVLFLGVLYHLRHPLLALEIVCGLTTDVAIVESFVIDAENWKEHQNAIPSLEFYETFELGNQYDNWSGLTVTCLLAMCRAAGFARVELMFAGGNYAGVACYRKWEDPPAIPESAPPQLLFVSNGRTPGNCFSTRKSEEYLECVFRPDGDREIKPEDLRLEVSGFGTRAIYVQRREDGSWAASFRLPPALSARWHPVRLRLAGTAFGNELRIAVDFPPEPPQQILVKDISDGITWDRGQVSLDRGGFVSLWISGLPENRSALDMRVMLGEVPLQITWIGPTENSGYSQINAKVPPDLAKGPHDFQVRFAGVRSEPQVVRVL
jgi:tRNA (mo5U34)-methyltransferase